MNEVKYTIKQTKGFDARGVIRRMNRGSSQLTARTVDVIAHTATVRAPFLTGHLKQSISKTHTEGSKKGSVKVGAFYGVYVNYGTRFMRPQPFFSQGVNAGRLYMKANAGRIFH